MPEIQRHPGRCPRFNATPGDARGYISQPAGLVDLCRPKVCEMRAPGIARGKRWVDICRPKVCNDESPGRKVYSVIPNISFASR